MPLYDYRCPKGHTTERQIGLADFDATTRVICGRGGCREEAERVICAPVLKGLAVVGGESWTGSGRWTGKAAAESDAADGARRRIEAGLVEGNDFLKGRTLAYLREHEMARDLGMVPEAQAIEHGIRSLNAEADRIRAGAPQIVKIGGQKAIKETATRQRGARHERAVSYRAV